MSRYIDTDTETFTRGKWKCESIHDVAKLLRESFDVLDAWGFKYITILTWDKGPRGNFSCYFQGKTEHCLFGRRGSIPYKKVDNIIQVGNTIVYEDKTVHSAKPLAMREMIERVSFPPYVELFARNQPPRENWTFWENKAEDLLKPE